MPEPYHGFTVREWVRELDPRLIDGRTGSRLLAAPSVWKFAPSSLAEAGVELADVVDQQVGALWDAKWPPWSYIVQRTMLLWSRSARRRMPLKSPPKPARAIGTVVG